MSKWIESEVSKTILSLSDHQKKKNTHKKNPHKIQKRSYSNRSGLLQRKDID